MPAESPRRSWTRREFLRSLAVPASVVGLTAVARQRAPLPSTRPQLSVDQLARFVDPLYVPPRAAPVGVRGTLQAATPIYRLRLNAVSWQVHRDVPPTRMWSFGSAFPGPTIEATRGQGLWIDWVNNLPHRHFLPIDPTIHGAEPGTPESRAVVHVHGARVRPEYDGHPEHWTTPGQTASYYYPNAQDAATLWYHDHTMGINRLNLYAGLMGIYLVRDAAEDELGLPSGPHDLPLLLCDRIFDTHGQLVYPESGDPARPWVPEVYGDAMLVNGRLFPFANVEPVPYRLRFINACNGRYLHLAMTDGVPMYLIGGDQGLLERAVRATRVDLLSAERAEVVVDFSGHAGRRVVLQDGARPIVEWHVGTGHGTRFAPPATLRVVERLAPKDDLLTHTHRITEMSDPYRNPMRMLLDNRRWHDAVTETARLGSTEIWNIVNPTQDAHPIHLHLVRFQILDRRPFEDFTSLNTRAVRYVGPPVPPDPAEAAWKDTVRVEPGMVTRLIVRFEGFPGRYMWHCHLAEHGDNEMMRPLEILPAP